MSVAQFIYLLVMVKMMLEKNLHNVLKVFIASPGDVKEERRILKEEIEDINKIVREINWHIDLYGWEDTLPGIGRPQEHINKDVDFCDLFVGILWKRWGQSTGEFSSGFEEEFFRAKKRFSESNKPDIWILFKKIDTEIMGDAGPQLANVLKFRKEQEMLKQIFFQEFLDTEEYRGKIREYLMKYILKASNSIERFAEGTSTHAISPLKKDQESRTVHSSDEVKEASMPSQVIELIESVNMSIKNKEFKFPKNDNFDENRFNIARFYLIASTWLSQGYSTELLDPHCINILFRYKEKLELTPMERDYIFRTIIGSGYDNTAGWFWLGDLESDNIRDRLFYHAIFDDNENLRLNSIKLLELAKLRPNKTWKDINVFEFLLNDKLESIKKKQPYPIYHK